MKYFLFCCLILSSFIANAQNRAVSLDPSIGQVKVTDINGNQINENYIQPGQLIKLILPVSIINQDNPLPKGSCKIKIGLGSKLQLDPTFNLSNVNSSNYFNWSIVNAGGQAQLTGELVNELPSNFQQVEVAFKVLGNVAGKSTITANFLITNHNTITTLADNDASNNVSFLAYEVTNVAAPTPITTITALEKLDCSLKVNFGSNREINLIKYVIEMSKNGVDFINVNEVVATSQTSYVTNFSVPIEMQTSYVVVRVKAVYSTGAYLYSNVMSLSGICNGKWKVNMYPNPVKGNETVLIKAIDGVFKGKYSLTITDASGKILKVSQLTLNNVLNFNYNIGNMASGKYALHIVNTNNTESALLQFEKL